MSDPHTVVVLAPNWLGDAVMALPAIADVRRRFSAARLLIAARRSVADLFGLVASIDQVIVFEGKKDADALRAADADAAVLLPNSFASAWLVKRARIPERWGYGTDWRAPLLTRAIRRPKGSLHQGAYYQYLVHALGIESGPLEPALTIPESAVEAASRLLIEKGWDAKQALVVLAPGAAYGTAKRWIPAHVSRLVSELVRHGHTCVLVGSRGDAATTGAIRRDVVDEHRGRVIDLAGATTLELLAGVMSLARACVSNDSGAMHLAGATGTPVVAVFGPTREWETAPLTRGRAEVITHPVWCRPCMLRECPTHPVWCRPCMLRECPIDHRCMTGITPGSVLSAVERLGSDPASGASRGQTL
jgi:heptosyltransferase-2